MKILVPGVEPKEKFIRTFQCDICGCIFEADLTEYKATKFIDCSTILGYHCKCPHNDCDGVGYELTDDNMFKAMILQRDKVNKEKDGK